MKNSILNSRINKVIRGFSIFLFFINSTCIIAQNKNVKTPDLSDMNYEELREAFYNSYYKEEFNSADSIARLTLLKAKKENDSIAIINSFIRLGRNNEKHYYLSQIYLDSSILFSQKIKNIQLLGESYFFKGQLMKNHNQYKDALENYIKARNIYREIGNQGTQMAIQHMIGMLKLRTGDYEQALKMIEEIVSFEKNKLEFSKNNLNYIISLHDLAIVYAANEMYDTTSKINKEGYLLAKKNPEYEELYFTHLEGANQYYKGNLTAARDSLLKAIPFLKSNNDLDLTFSYYYLGKISEIENDKEKSIFYFKKIDSIYSDTKYIMNEPRPAYESLINYYRNKNDLKNQLYYLNRLLKIDSILDSQYSGLSKTFYKEYDTPMLLEEKAKIIDELDNSNNTYKIIIGFALLVCLALILLIVIVTKSKQKSQKRFEEIISEIKDRNSNESFSKSKSREDILDIDEEIQRKIAINLGEFEEKLGFLKPKLNLKGLSSQIDVHSRYVSKYINHEKGKNIQNYINDLRVDYAINKLKEDHVFRKYTIKAIAHEVGFTNTESFTKAFKKRTSITVSFFLKKLNV